MIEPFAEIVDVSAEAYHAKTEYLSKSMLSVFADCPARFAWIYREGGEKPTTDAMRLGTAAHLFAMERDKFAARYHVLPDGVVRNAKHKAYQEQLEIAGDREILRPSDMDKISGMAAALEKDRKARKLLEKAAHIEKSIFWRDEETGLMLRCRPDIIRTDGIIIDLKTTASAKPETFHRTAYDKMYDVSVAMICDGYEACNGGKAPEEYVFLAIETEPPYIVEAYNSFEKADDCSYRDVGNYRLRKLLSRYQECLKTNTWPGYSSKVTPMRVPAWEMKKLEME